MFPLKEMYNIAFKINDHGIEGYDVKPKYEDPVHDKKRLTKSTINIKKHVTDRGSYLKDNQKIKRDVPGPGSYLIKNQFVQQKKLPSKSMKAIKKTYIDDIIDKQKKNKEPAPGQYNIQIKEKSFSKKKGVSHDKITYLDQVEYESSAIPGPGAYNPHLPSHPLQNLMKKPDYWIKKSLEKQKKITQMVPTPDSATYNPKPTDYKLFGIENKLMSKSKFTSFGKDERFIENRTKKTKLIDAPGPGHYALLNKWKGKDKQQDINLLDKYSKAPPKRVYY